MDEDEIQIVFTGKRPGEKLHEELFGDEEQLEATSCPGISVAHREQSVDKWTRVNLDRLVAAAERRDWPELDRYLEILLPAFGPMGHAPSVVPEEVLTPSVVPEDVRTLPALQETS